MSHDWTPLRWTSGGLTDQGRVRQVNQDALLDRPDLGLWAVADGMGGHSSGGMASRLIVERLGRMGRPQWLGAGVEQVDEIIADVNHRLIEEAVLRDDDIIGSTLVALLAVADHAAILWAGDSRAYRLRGGGLVQLTRDHTQARELVEQGLLTPEQAERHPLSNVLVRAVGGDIDLELDRRVEAVLDGDRYLLASDGLDKELSLARIAALLGSPQLPAECARALVEAALEAGGRDNITALVVDFAHA